MYNESGRIKCLLEFKNKIFKIRSTIGTQDSNK